jgi:hypothetical protein
MTRGSWLRVARPAVKVRGMRSPAAAARVLLVLAVVLAAGAGRADERVIRYEKDALTVRLTNVPVAEVVDEIGRQSGAQIRGQVRAAREITAEFDAVPLPEALHRLLGDQNFALIYGDDGRLAAVRLLGGPLAPPPPAPPPPAQTPPQTASSNLAALVARHEPVPVTGRLAQAVGATSASFQQLFDLALHNEDATLRADALRAVVGALEADPALRSAVVGELNNVDDGALGSLLRSAAGEHAEEIAMQIMTQARASEIRVKASSVLQKLRAGS